VIAIDLGSERLSSDGPDAGFVFFHGDGFGDAVESERDPGSGGIFIGEGDAVVGVDLSGMEMRAGAWAARESGAESARSSVNLQAVRGARTFICASLAERLRSRRG
jgi:hypothetical protein